MNLLTPHVAEILILAFLAITFGISLIEKFSDWERIFNFFQKTFEKTFLKGYAKPLMAILMFFETFNFCFVVVGLFQLIVYGEKENALLACIFSAITTLYMLLGQRIAKNYAGANSLSIYFIICVFGIFLLG